MTKKPFTKLKSFSQMSKWKEGISEAKIGENIVLGNGNTGII